MKLKGCAIYLFMVISSLFFSGFSAYSQEINDEDIYVQMEEEADRLQRLLDLEDWQVFYVDSTLKHDIPAMKAEFDRLTAEKVTNSSLFIAVQDKWWDKIDASYKKIFTPEQWEYYLKTGAGKNMKQREKRREEASAPVELKKKRNKRNR